MCSMDNVFQFLAAFLSEDYVDELVRTLVQQEGEGIRDFT